jgi:hypothetical protein
MKPTQNCALCTHQAKCWSRLTNNGKPISSQNVLINILICRLQLGIDRDKSAANLIKIFRPGIIRLISQTRQSEGIAGIDFEHLFLDMQSMAIQYLLYDYKIGDRGRATPYLFNPQQGFLVKWIKWTVSKNKKFYYHHELYNPIAKPSEINDDFKLKVASTASDAEQSDPLWTKVTESGIVDSPDENDDDGFTQNVMDIINDGVTLNRNEYRVISFCLANANEANNSRHIDGLHIYLAHLLGVSRPRITRLYARGREHLKMAYTKSRVAEEDNA